MSVSFRGGVELLRGHLRIRRDVSGEAVGLLVPSVHYDLEPWRLASLEACHPWPRLRARTRDGEDLTVGPGRDVDEEAMSAEVERIFEWAEANTDARLDRGWLAHPIVPWRRADEWPTSQKPLGAGAFRTAAVVSDPLVAQRSGATPLERFFIWLATGTPSCDDDVALTEEFVYRRRGRLMERVPRDTLRAVRRSEDGDRVFFFGRSTRLVLPSRPAPCAVVEQLEADLRR